MFFNNLTKSIKISLVEAFFVFDVAGLSTYWINLCLKLIKCLHLAF